MNDVKKPLLIGCAGLLACGFFGFILVFAVLWQVTDDEAEAKKSKVAIVVQHKLYDNRPLLLGHQCLSHVVLITDYAGRQRSASRRLRVQSNRAGQQLSKL